MKKNNTNNQNATLMVTSLEDNGDYILSYIPLSIDMDLLQHILSEGKSTNSEVVQYVLDCDEKTYWKDMWESFKEEPENDA